MPYFWPGLLCSFFVITVALPAGGTPIALDTVPTGDLAEPQNKRALPEAGSALPDENPLADGEHLPLMIRWSNWQPEFGPALVYAREQDLEGMLRMDGPVVKMFDGHFLRRGRAADGQGG